MFEKKRLISFVSLGLLRKFVDNIYTAALPIPPDVITLSGIHQYFAIL
ncbi:hypothetical protein SAMN05216490_4048 [Mucilaginibacter mallensis]|uniref:Uncharacterized protein n=1 Tax=Mucilaginibacter mallensis TaxID=652787 RepID=A0A1H2BCU1_MUCMA|nr:hypothetical protein SAMN05216490_4048 [Mucilaginibacter mallensis]